MRARITQVYIHETRLRGMFSTGGEVYKWFGKNVLRRLIPEARSELRPGKGIRTGRMSRSLRARIRGTNQYLLRLEMEATAPHAVHYIFDTNYSGKRQSMGSQSPLTYPNPYPATGGPKVLRIVRGGAVRMGKRGQPPMVWAATGRRGYKGHNFLDNAMETVLRKRRLL